MRRRPLLGLLAGLSGGCLRLTNQSGNTATPSPVEPPTTTAADPANGDTATADSDRQPEGQGSTQTTAQSTGPTYPVGLSDEGVDGFLLGTHRNVLSSEGFRTNWTLVRVDLNLFKEQKEFRVDDGTAIGSWSNPNGGDLTMYRTGADGFWREDLGSSYTYGEDRHGFSLEVLTMSEWLAPILNYGEWTSPSLMSNGDVAVWESSTTGVDTSSTRIGFFTGNFESLSAELRVDERGVIRQLVAEFAAVRDRDNQTTRYQLRYSVDSVGGVTVEEPSWLPTARERRPQVSVSITNDQRSVEFMVDSGNAIEAGTIFTLFDRVSNLNVIATRLNEAIEPGETVYFYHLESDEDRVARGTPPDDPSAVTLDSSYGFWAERATAEYFETVNL